MNGQIVNNYSSSIITTSICENNTGDGVVVNHLDEMECKSDGYDWTIDTTTEDLYFQVTGLNNIVGLADVQVEVTVKSTTPYVKELSSIFKLSYDNTVWEQGILEHTSYPDYEKVVITNISDSVGNFLLKFNSDHLRISEIIPSTVNAGMDGYVNEAEFEIEPRESVVIYFYKVVESEIIDESDFTIINLNDLAPEVADGLIPVIYDEDLSEWVKVDPNGYNWFNYNRQQWANAVTVVNDMRASYIAADYGTVIPMEDIMTFLVWIPRYSYTIRDTYGYQGPGALTPSVTTPGAIDIKFVDNTVTEYGSGSYTGSVATNFVTPSAFCWGNSCDDPVTRDNPENREVNGFWIAKFEASRNGDLLYSKPNEKSAVNHTMLAQFTLVQNLMNGNNGYVNYGFVGNVDAHLIKNTEWGAIAYLSQSVYGKYGSPEYSGINKEVYPNNCTLYITGIGGNSPTAGRTTSTCYTNTYDTYYGMGASTTGNIYGVYDMVGGTFDRVMGAVLSSNGTFDPDLSGFTSLPEGRYINVYPAGDYGISSTVTYFGDALTETLGFYGDRFVQGEYYANHWFYRGGSLWSDNTVINGVFSYTTFTGQADLNHSSRFTISTW